MRNNHSLHQGAPDKPGSQKPEETQSDTLVPIVGIGASAGGLEAFEQFFHAVPSDSGIAFILVPHLDPDHESLLVDILGRATSMPVLQAEDLMQIDPDHVYIIPPNREMTVFHQKIHLNIPETHKSQRMKIDLFFRSLAEDQEEKAIGIILSGTGTDGTQGLRAIQGSGGITFVQEPGTAKYDGMPTSAISNGYATFILPIEEMPAQIISSVKTLTRERKQFHPAPEDVIPPDLKGSISRILQIIRSRTGHDFSQYKKSTISRRITRRMAVHMIEETGLYARYLNDHPEEVQILFRELLINVTSFFRDPEVFDLLKTTVLPDLLGRKDDHEPFRVWVPGCATGEEAYSLAIIIREILEALEKDCKVQIYSTDIAEDVIAFARKGLYPLNIVSGVSADRLKKYFIREDNGFRVKKEIREMVIYATQNLIKDPPFTHLDLLSCRNLLIYFESELQERLIPAFHYALRPGGILILSSSESIGSFPDLFKPLNRKWKIYTASGVRTGVQAMMQPPTHWKDTHQAPVVLPIPPRISETNVADLMRQHLLQTYAPPSVVTDEFGTIMFVYGDTGKFLRPAQGQATLSVVEMAREGLQLDLRTAIFSARTKKKAVSYKSLQVQTNGGFENVDLEVRPITISQTGHEGLIISFLLSSDQTPGERKIQGKKSRHRAVNPDVVENLEQELQYTKENLQATIEEMQAANEELKSTNEELQSTNEELQSANEEMETSKEEIQSVNEEMMTVNAELQSKIRQLTGIQNDMKNLLSSTGVATIFLDSTLQIRWFTPEAGNLYKIIPSDIGRPLADIKSVMEDDDMIEDARQVLDTLIPIEKEIQTIQNAWYLARIVPYRTLENVIDGVVLSCVDISTRKSAEEEVIRTREYAMSIVNTVREPLLILDHDLMIISANNSFYRTFIANDEDIEGVHLTKAVGGRWNDPYLISRLNTILPDKTSFEDLELHYSLEYGDQTLILNARVIYGKNGVQDLILLAIEDASELFRAKQAIFEANRKLKLLSGLTRHDIINHISAIVLTLDILDNEKDPEVLRQRVREISDICMKMEATIGFTREYEDFGTVSSGWQPIHPAIESAISEVTHAGVIIEEGIPRDVEVYSEPMLRKVFATLIENAVRHGEKLTQIRFSAREADTVFIITCEDDGVGVPEESKELIFNHGYGSHTGIGLFLAREILSITDLKIMECGIPGEGARFEISIPAGKYRRV